MRWLHATAAGLVDDPKSIFIETSANDTISSFVLRVASGDVGKIVGKHGRTARSLRTLFYGIGRRLGYRFELDIRPEDPEWAKKHGEPTQREGVTFQNAGRVGIGVIKLDNSIGTCVHCLCTYHKPCHLLSGRTCSWANAAHTLCSNPECREKQNKIDALHALVNNTARELMSGGIRG
jgi:predicted RNA-binding protein YlqC (UPF0109 family)